MYIGIWTCDHYTDKLETLPSNKFNIIHCLVGYQDSEAVMTGWLPTVTEHYPTHRFTHTPGTHHKPLLLAFSRRFACFSQKQISSHYTIPTGPLPIEQQQLPHYPHHCLHQHREEDTASSVTYTSNTAMQEVMSSMGNKYIGVQMYCTCSTSTHTCTCTPTRYLGQANFLQCLEPEVEVVCVFEVQAFGL